MREKISQVLLRNFIIKHSWRIAEQNSHLFERKAIFSFDSIGEHIQKEGIYEKLQLAQLVRICGSNLKESTIIDVGANIGNHSAYLANFCKKVVAIEPNPDAFKLLQINVPENVICKNRIIQR